MSTWWIDLREWATFVMGAAVLFFVAYDLWWVRRPRLRVRIRRFHDSDRLDLIVINRGGGPLTVLDVYLEVNPEPMVGLKVAWNPDDGTLPISLSGGSAAVFHLEIEAPVTLILAGVPFGERFFKVPDPGWEGRRRRLQRREAFGGITKELRGQRAAPSPEQPLEYK